MPYDQGLEVRIDEIIEGRKNTKKKMFGGIGYLRSGNMAFGIWRDCLIVRCGPVQYKECLKKRHTKEFDITGKPMAGWVMVAPEGLEEDSGLKRWLKMGDAYASTLPPKK